jgi:tRNA(His) 5'-end guanylyltransferase
MSLGDRIKRYEGVNRNFATPRMPLVVRVDGKAFHTFTRGLGKPFDKDLMDCMDDAAIAVAGEMQGFKAAYVQSDEVTFLLTDYDDINTQGWFNYNISKIISISAAKMSVEFSCRMMPSMNEDVVRPPVFDSRAFNVPVDDVTNMFLWRAQDWERNSLQMYARSFFSHKELHKKNRSDIHEMLHGIGKNWATDLSCREKNGVFFINYDDGIESFYDREPKYDSINEIIEPLIKLA